MRICDTVKVPVDEETDVEQLHVHPTEGREHVLGPECWCRPELDWAFLGPGAPSVWIHRTIH